MENYNFKIIDENKKQVEITYKNKTLKFKLKIKRAFTVLKALLEAYPNFINIHSLDGVLNDPNRAQSDLRIGDGFGAFLIEKKDKRRVVNLKLDVEKLFEYHKNKSSEDFISLSVPDLRETLTPQQKEEIYNKFKGRCNITKVKVYREFELKGNYFFKHSLLATYDHRKPLSKGGSNELDNIQLISVLANDEKNKICNMCKNINCEKCALAYPDKFYIIQANNQDIRGLRIADND